MASVILILISSLSLGTACAFTATAAVVYGSENTTTLNEVLNEDQSSWLGNMDYCKVTSCNKSHLEAYAVFFRLLMKRIFNPYVLKSFDKKLIFLISNAH